jgi:hypothetical protein
MIHRMGHDVGKRCAAFLQRNFTLVDPCNILQVINPGVA